MLCCLSPSNFKPQLRYVIDQNTMPGPICSVNFSSIGSAVSEIFNCFWDCPFPVAKFSHQSNSNLQEIQLPENYKTVFYDIRTTNREGLGAYVGRKWGWSNVNCGCYRSNTKLIFWMHVIQKLLNRLTWNIYTKCKSIHPLCLWHFTTIWEELHVWESKDRNNLSKL